MVEVMNDGWWDSLFTVLRRRDFDNSKFLYNWNVEIVRYRRQIFVKNAFPYGVIVISFRHFPVKKTSSKTILKMEDRLQGLCFRAFQPLKIECIAPDVAICDYVPPYSSCHVKEVELAHFETWPESCRFFLSHETSSWPLHILVSDWLDSS